MRNYRNLALTNPTNLRPNYIQSPIHHVVTQLSQNDNTYEQTIEQPHTFQSQNNHFSAHDEQTNWIPPPFKFPSCQNQFPIIPLFAFPPPDSPHINTSFGMDSDANSDITFFHTISQLDNSDLETPDLQIPHPAPRPFLNPETLTSQKLPFNPSYCVSPSTPSHVSQITPTYSPFTTERSTNHSPDNTQTSDELNNLITLQQQVQYPHIRTIH